MNCIPMGRCYANSLLCEYILHEGLWKENYFIKYSNTGAMEGKEFKYSQNLWILLYW